MNKNKFKPLALSVALMSGAYVAGAQAVDSCGYTVEAGVTSSWNSGYQGFVKINNISGDAASDFEVLIKTGSSSISSVFSSPTQPGQGGTVASAPDWLIWSPIRQGTSYEVGFLANGVADNLSAELISINGDDCGEQEPHPPPVDTIDPEAGIAPSQVSFTAPGTLVLDAFAVDNVGVTKVELVRNGTVVAQDTFAPYSFDVALDEGDNGTQTFAVRAYDAAGNTGLSNSVSVVVDISSGGDTIKPETGLNANQISFTDAGTLILDAFAVDNVGVTKVVFLRDGQPVAEDTTYPYSQQFALTSADNGTYAYSVVAYDAAGNTGTSNSLSIEVNIGSEDTISPEAGLAGSQATFSEPGTLVLDAFAVDNVGVEKVVFKRDGQVIGEATTAPYTLSVPLAAADNGVVTFSATAYDAAGNTGDTNPVVVTVSIESSDDITPQVGINTSQVEYAAGETLSIDAFAVDNVGVTKVAFLRDGVVVAEDTAAPYSFETVVSEGGAFVYTAVAYDAAGNSKESNPLTITVTGASDRFLGTAVGSDGNFEGVADYFNQVTPDNAGKWASLEPERDVMNWDALDEAYQFAKDNNMPFKLHTLVWGQQAPSWIDDLSPGEQISELAQLMHLISERYSDIDMIDVVNEPLHAPAGFREALGGEGLTGWDWVITAFSMARSYFPDSKLLLNDYNVLILEEYTQSYLEIVQLLQTTTMLDGIGVQAHFLERADVGVVASNLQLLADTGLPVYVSELDVNFADDARQANVLKDLFTVFWENPAVRGVTYWGFEEGKMWREESHLLRTDGSERPAMTWMQCYYAGGTDCTVPEYIPTGWTGDEYGLTLEGELYDEALDVLALGDSVAYTDDGDWFKYNKVTFDESWEKLWVTYIKGNDSAANISFHLDELDSEPFASVDLETTGGWGSSKKLELEIPSISGEHDLYIKFNGGYGVGNLDKVRFGKPVTSGLGPNLVPNAGFESASTSGWFTWDGSLTTSSVLVYEGNYSLMLTDREGNGPAAYSLIDEVNPGSTYKVSMMVTVDGTASADVNVTQKISCEGMDDAYGWLVSPVTVSPGDWVELAGNLVVPSDCTLTDVAFFAEGPEGGINLYIDNVSAQELVSSVTVLNSDFETGTLGGWSSWGGSLDIVMDNVYTGDYSLMLSDREESSAVVYDLTSDVTSATDYQVSAAVTVEGEEPSSVHITSKVVCDGEEAEYNWLASSDAVIDGQWKVLNGSLSIPDCAVTEALIYLEGPSAGVNLLLDDVVVSQ